MFIEKITLLLMPLLGGVFAAWAVVPFMRARGAPTWKTSAAAILCLLIGGTGGALLGVGATMIGDPKMDSAAGWVGAALGALLIVPFGVLWVKLRRAAAGKKPALAPTTAIDDAPPTASAQPDAAHEPAASDLEDVAQPQPFAGEERSYRVDHVVDEMTETGTATGMSCTPDGRADPLVDPVPKDTALTPQPKPGDDARREWKMGVFFAGFSERQKEELTELAKNNGWMVFSALHRSVDYMVAGGRCGSAQRERAEDLGVHVISAEEFRAMPPCAHD